MIKVVLVDDHILLRNALAGIIQSFEGFTVLFEAKNGQQFIDMLDPLNLPEIVLLDVTMPVMNGFDTACWISTHHPQIKVIALSMLNDEPTIIRMLKNGAKGYLLKDTELDDLKKALHDVANKGMYINTLLYQNIVQSIHGVMEYEDQEQQILCNLNEREKEFLRWLCTDKSYKEIAAEMYLSPRTIDGYRDSLFDKLKVSSRVGLVLFAIKHGISKL